MNGVVERVSYEWRCLQPKGGKLPATRTNAAVFVYDGAVWMMGGFGAGVGRSAEVWQYNIKEGGWRLVLNKGHDNPPIRDGHSITPIGNGAVLVFGGQGSSAPNEKSERNLDIVRTKTFLIRDLYNDLFKWDCQLETWTMMCPEGGVPLCRRGHSAVFLPFGAYSASSSSSSSSSAHHAASRLPSTLAGSSKQSPSKRDAYPPVPENSMVVFGGSGMEVSKYIEAVYNDTWVYNVDVGRWSKQRTRGPEPKPLFDHRAERVGELMVVVGGITSTNARPFISGEPIVENNDVIILNLQTVTWSVLEVNGPNHKPVKLNIHGHSLVADPFTPNSGILFLFGGKENIDGRKAAHESVAGAKKLLRKAAAKGSNFTFQLDIKKGIITQLEYKKTPPERRYQHLAVSLTNDELTQRPKLVPRMTPIGLKLPPPVEEPVMMVFGGARVELGGYCDNVMFELVRTRMYIDTEADDPVGDNASVHEDGHSVASHASGGQASALGDHSSVGSIAQPHDDLNEEEEDDDRKPSIWEKLQTQRKLAGEAPRAPSNWAELKLALSTSQTERRIHGEASSSSRSGKLASIINASTLLNEESSQELVPETSTTLAPTSAFDKKQEAKRQMLKIKALSSSVVMPLIKGKNLTFIAAKSTYCLQHPPPVPPRVGTSSVATLQTSHSQAGGLATKSHP